MKVRGRYTSTLADSPIVSVCLPVFNGEAFLQQALESVLSQSFQDFELLIADDCSTDSSPEIIDRFARKDSRVVSWRNSSRLGLFGNYNQCLERACGTFIKPFAQDDLLDSRLLHRQVEVLSSYDQVALVTARRLVINEFGYPIDDSQPGVPDLLGQGPVYSSDLVIATCLGRFVGNPIGEPCTVMFPKACSAPGFNTIFRHLGDLDYWLRILKHGDLAVIDEPLVSFRKHQSSSTAHNIRHLWAFSDCVHLAEANKQSLSRLGLSQDDYLKSYLSSVASFVATLPEEDLKRSASSADDTPADVAALKQAFLVALQMLSEPEEAYGTARLGRELRSNELKIQALEQRLEILLSSLSWRVTRPLREVNRLISGRNGQTAEVVDFHEFSVPIKRQRAYLAHLKRQVDNILASRSWQMSKLLRSSSAPFFEQHASESNKLSMIESGGSDGKHQPREELSPDVSVIIPVFNGKCFLRQAVESVIGQTLPPKELILVDDGSTDGSLEALDGLEFPFPVIRQRQENAGQSAARNLGIRCASGEFIAFLDQDDLWYPEHLKRLREMFFNDTDSQLGWVYSNLDEVDKDGRMVTRKHLDHLPFEHPKRSLLRMLAEDMHILPSASLIRTAVLREVGGFDESFCGYEDDDLFLRIFRAGYGNEYLNEALSQWRVYTDSTCYANPRMDKSLFTYMQKLAALFPDGVRRYTSDCIVPRFLTSALARYDRALSEHELSRASDLVTDMLTAFPDQPGAGRSYTTMMIVPRLRDHLSHRYAEAASEGDSRAMAAIRSHRSSIPGLVTWPSVASRPGSSSAETAPASSAVRAPERVPVLILMDVEPLGRTDLTGGGKDNGGMELAYEWFSQARPGLEERTGSPVNFNWFLRMDPQIEQTYGDAAWIPGRYRDQFERLLASGDELGLHPHMFRWDNRLQQWFVDYEDQKWIERCVTTSTYAYEKTFGVVPTSLRFGDRWLTNAAVELAERLGFRYDLTIEPGQKEFSMYQDEITRGAQSDFISAPEVPFRPSAANFLRPAVSNARSLWMIPVTTGTVGDMLWTVNMDCSPECNRQVIDAKLASSEDPMLVLVGRTGELVDKQYGENCLRNLDMLASHPAVGRFSFVTPGTAIEMFEQRQRLALSTKASSISVLK